MSDKSIMLVDDAAFMRMMLKEILTKNGYTNIVAEASNGLEAIEKYKKFNPDLTIMDITMPEMTGIEAVRGIIQNDSKALIVMCSAMGQQAMV